MKLERGMLMLSLWPSPNRGGVWVENDAIADALHEIEGVSEVGSCGAQSSHIIVKFDSIEDMNAKLPGIERQIMAVLENRSLRARR
jgi:multidrug efflux pump subunit AcrB